MTNSFAVTFFEDHFAKTKQQVLHTMETLAARIAETSAPTKGGLPWLKLARFGNQCTEAGCLRHDDNMLAISGIEADYDGELISFDEARERLEKNNVSCILYASPSAAPGKPRWRAICRLSEEAYPSQRRVFIGRLNGLFGGIFDAESWTSSQAYYFGRVGNNPEHRVAVIDGMPIDLLVNLEEISIGKPNTKVATGNSDGGAQRIGPIAEPALLRQIINGKSYHESCMRLLGKWALNDVPMLDAKKKLLAAFDAVVEADRDKRWKSRRAETDRCLAAVYVKEAKKRDIANGSSGGDPKWQDGLLRDDGRRVFANLANVAHALRDAPELAGLLALDQMACQPMLRAAVPGARIAAETFPHLLTDGDIHALQEWLQHAGLPHVSRDTVQQAADLVAGELGYHPVRTWLNDLAWDGTPRLSTWLTTYLGVKRTDYTDAVGQWFLIAMVARVMQPGAQVDHMLVLEGEQGALKSSACRVLGGAWFSDNLPPLQHADEVRLSMHLRGKWLVEIAELASFGKADIEILKSFITRREERYLPKFARREVIEPRQCCFVASTNEGAYLKDETGGRRFWPVKVHTIDPAALEHDRDQLFAEALDAFQNNAAWWPDAAFEDEHIKPQQASRFVEDAWSEAITRYFVENEKVSVTILELAHHALFMGTGRLGTADQRRIARVLVSLGWQRGAKKEFGVVWWPGVNLDAVG
jgi:predicted P-loop ATPase